MKSRPLTERHAIADLWSDFDGTWTRNFRLPLDARGSIRAEGSRAVSPGSVGGRIRLGGQTA